VVVEVLTPPPSETGVRRFYIGYGVFAIAVSIAGFGPSLINQSMRKGPPTPLVLAHGALSFLWLLLFLTQAMLIASGRKDVHRRLGPVGIILAFAVVVVGCWTGIVMQARSYDLSGDLIRTAGVSALTPDGVLQSLTQFLVFGGLVAAALWFRHRSDIHKRLMLLAIFIPLLGEPVGHLAGHLIGYWPALRIAAVAVAVIVSLIFLALSAIHDRLTEGRIHPVSLWVPIGLVATVVVMALTLGQSDAWLRFSRWLVLGS
jgi:hypothetical protein